jgi:hypothetical protein
VKFSEVLDQLPIDPSAGQVFGEPYVTPDGTTLIPVAKVRDGKAARPLGIFVVRGEKASWVGAVDNNRVALIGVLTGLVATTFGTLAVLRQPPWPRITITG